MQDVRIGCGACAFWKETSRQDGTCLHNAPRPTERVDQIAHWPVTGRQDWCGEAAPHAADGPRVVGCRECRYWMQHGDAAGLDPQDRLDRRMDWWRDAGHCVRHAPGSASSPGLRGFWRATHGLDGCAEGRRRQ